MIRWQTRVEHDVLLVRASGEDDDLAGVRAYGQAVIEAALQAGVHRVLCDERELHYRIGIGDTWAAATALAEAVPAIARVALVSAPEAVAMARFWEDTAFTRGLQCRVFLDVEAARRWLAATASAAD